MEVQIKTFKEKGVTYLSLTMEGKTTTAPIVMRLANFPTLKPLRVAQVAMHNTNLVSIQLPKWSKSPDLFIGLFIDDWINTDGVRYYKAGDVHTGMQPKDFDIIGTTNLAISN